MFSSFFRKPVRRSLDLQKIQAVLFDLDGTLIDVDMQRFVPGYLRRLTDHMSEHVDPVQATHVLHQAVAAMFANTDSGLTLERILFAVLHEKLAMSSKLYDACLERFCENDLASLRPLVKSHPLSPQLLDTSLSNGWQVVLATNPIFPRAVVDARIAWGGLNGDTFHHVTSYESAHFCKPNPAFFEELVDQLQIPAERCLMIGNDNLHDLAASQVGMQTCLLTPWQIRRPGTFFEADWQGNHEELLAMLGSAMATSPE